MTPHIKTIILSNGEVLSDQGVVRCPKAGEWFIDRCGEPSLATFAHGEETTIFTPLETQGQKIERRGDLWIEGAITNHQSANPLIDAACAVVNSMAYTDPVAESALAKLAATLEPFTQAVKEERWWVQKRGTAWYVNDSEADDRFAAKFFCESDAKAFADMKNSQSEGGE